MNKSASYPRISVLLVVPLLFHIITEMTPGLKVEEMAIERANESVRWIKGQKC